MKQLRGAPSIILSALTGDGRIVPVNFGRSFNIGRNFLWTYEGGIGNIMGIEPVLNSVDANFNQGRATVFNALLAEMGLIPRIDQFITFEPCHFQVVDLITGATFALVQKAVITGAQTVINRAMTISDSFNGIAQWAWFRDELEGGAST